MMFEHGLVTVISHSFLYFAVISYKLNIPLFDYNERFRIKIIRPFNIMLCVFCMYLEQEKCNMCKNVVVGNQSLLRSKRSNPTFFSRRGTMNQELYQIESCTTGNNATTEHLTSQSLKGNDWLSLTFSHMFHFSYFLVHMKDSNCIHDLCEILCLQHFIIL